MVYSYIVYMCGDGMAYLELLGFWKWYKKEYWESKIEDREKTER